MRINILFLLLIISRISLAQTPIVNTRYFDKIQEKELNNYERNSVQNRTGATGFTMASSNFDISYYRCEWQIDPAIRFIAGKVTSAFSVTQATNSISFDLSDTLTVDSVIYHGLPLGFARLANDELKITFPLSIPKDQKDSVTIYYKGIPRWGTGQSSFVQTYHAAATSVIWTLSEPYGAKEWWPCKNGLDDKADSIDVIISHPSAYNAASNGIMVNSSASGGTTVTQFRHRYPIATYLVALAVSDYSVLADTVLVGSKIIPLVDYAYPEYVPDFLYYRDNLKYSMRLFSRLFGDYPFATEKYGHTQFNVNGGMEHQTNSFINYPDPGLMNHELAHQWFGDKITCGSWQDIWLNEGFATYLQLLVNESVDIDLHRFVLRSFGNTVTSSPGGSVWVDDTTSSSRIFNSRLSYYKGSIVLNMLRWVIGDSTFFKGMRQYFNDPQLAYKYARTSDLKRNMEQVSGKNLTSFFQNWIYGQGYPSYNIQWSTDNNNIVYTKIGQTTSHNSVAFYDMPVPIRFKNNLKDTIVVFNNNVNNQTFLFNLGFLPDSAFFDPYYWILSRNNTIASSTCASAIGVDKLPFYKISWSQNKNDWTNLTVEQQRTSTDSAFENMPLYIHLSGEGKDSVILIKNIRYTFNKQIEMGFKIEKAFVTTSSCFLDNAYSIEKKASSNNPNEINIFPVPASDHVMISINNPTDNQLAMSLYSASGQLMYRTNVSGNGSDQLLRIPLVEFPKGVYILQVQGNKGLKFTRKIIK